MLEIENFDLSLLSESYLIFSFNSIILSDNNFDFSAFNLFDSSCFLILSSNVFIDFCFLIRFFS